MTSTNSYDYLNRLLQVTSNPAYTNLLSYAYQNNDPNQRTRMVMFDGGYWLYQCDDLGQVISGKKYWSDGTPVSGQQFEYDFDDIGNRKFAAHGGNEWGSNLRYENYTANSLNQYH